MTVVLARVDQKLIHGQVMVSWVPYLRADTIVVIDAEIAADPMSQKFMCLGLPREVSEVHFTTPSQLGKLLERPKIKQARVMLLFKTIGAVSEAARSGLAIETLNLGNLAYPQKNLARRLTESFYVTPEDEELLRLLSRQGLKLYLQTLPKSKVHLFKDGESDR